MTGDSGNLGRNGSGNIVLNQMKNKNDSLYRQDFAEVYIAESVPTKQEKSLSEPIQNRMADEEEKYRLFLEMRQIYKYPRSINSYGQDASYFYKQAKMMEDFEDDYSGNAEYSGYFTEYQALNYEQLRTYFTWRTNVRRGIVKKTSFSYVFLYIYELIHNVGVKDSRDGFEKLLSIWREYGKYEQKLSKYMVDWVRDYYITNSFDISFQELVQQDELLQQYYNFSSEESYFDLYAPLSNYKFKKSAFYSAKTEKIFRDCFNFIIQNLDEWLNKNGVYFDDLIYYGYKGCVWLPFQRAVYTMQAMQFPEKKSVRISNAEIYWYENGRWTSSKNRIRRKHGCYIIGYIFRRIEQFYRKAFRFKYKLNVDKSKIDLSQIEDIISNFEEFFIKIDAAIFEFYKDSQKKSVTVNLDHLEKIRENALMIQGKLLTDPEEVEDAQTQKIPLAEQIPLEMEFDHKKEKNKIEAPPVDTDPWQILVSVLDETEREALRMMISGASQQELYTLSQKHFIMLEVLVDGINEKAMQTVEDNILELKDGMTVFEEYKYELERVILHETE